MAGIAPSSLQFQLAHIHDDRSLGLKVVEILGLILATAAVALRIASRRVSKVPLKADDITIIIALVLMYGLWTVNFLLVFRYGLGKHMAAVGAITMTHFFKALYAYLIFYTFIILTIKNSILLLYHRVFVNPRFQWHVRFWIAFTLLFQISTLLVDIFNCTPINYFWDKTVPHGHCVNIFAYFMACAAINVFTDLVILVLPMPMIWSLRIPTRQKLVLVGIFFMGGMVCIATVFRLVTFPYIDNNDLTWTYVECGYWTNSEVPLGVICACLPTLRPLFRKISPLSLTRGSGWSKSSKSRKSDKPFQRMVQWSDLEKRAENDTSMEKEICPLEQPVVARLSGAWRSEERMSRTDRY